MASFIFRCYFILPLLVGPMSFVLQSAASAYLSEVPDIFPYGHPTLFIGDVASWGRSLKQVAPSPTIENTSLILAAERTSRRDPLNHFQTYHGGWNISEKHYWASVGYTGWPGFVLAGAWFALGLCLVLLSLCCCCCCREKLKGKHAGGNMLPLIFLLLFTSAAVAGCVLLYIGQGKFHNEISESLHYVVNQSDTVVGKLREVSAVLTETESIHVLAFALTDADRTRISQLNVRLSTAANDLDTKTRDNSDKIRKGLDNVRLVMVIVAGVMLLFVILGLLFALLGIKPLLFLLVFIGWILVVCTWILCGIYILLNNCLGDTCVAMEEWVNNPSAKTSLDRILPCVDVDTARTTLSQTQRLANETVIGINNVISNGLNRDPSLGPPVPLLCDPVQPQLSPSGCVNLTNAPQVWAPYMCNNTSNGIACTSGGRITQQVYKQMNQSSAIINSLYVNTPFLLDLEDCEFVRQAFTTVRLNYCHQLRKFTKWEYIGLALVSGGSMLSVLFWIIYIRRRRHRHGGYSADGQPIYKGTLRNEPKPA